MAFLGRLNDTLGLVATMRRAGLIAPLRPDKYLRIAVALSRENMSAVSGFASAAQRCPDRPGLIDELGTLTWRDIDRRCDAYAEIPHAQHAFDFFGSPRGHYTAQAVEKFLSWVHATTRQATAP